MIERKDYRNIHGRGRGNASGRGYARIDALLNHQPSSEHVVELSPPDGCTQAGARQPAGLNAHSLIGAIYAISK